MIEGNVSVLIVAIMPLISSATFRLQLDRLQFVL